MKANKTIVFRHLVEGCGIDDFCGWWWNYKCLFTIKQCNLIKSCNT